MKSEKIIEIPLGKTRFHDIVYDIDDFDYVISFYWKNITEYSVYLVMCFCYLHTCHILHDYQTRLG